MIAPYPAERACAQACATIRANIALRSTNGAVATCMVLESTLRTWHRKATGTSLSPRQAEGGKHIA